MSTSANTETEFANYSVFPTDMTVILVRTAADTT